MYDFDIDTGKISNRRDLIKFSKSDGIPDGMTIDSEGNLWIAFWDGWRVGAYNSLTGKSIYNITMPVSRPTSCVFGGTNLDYLFITSARVELSENDFLDQPLAGSLFKYGPLVFRGVKSDTFKT